jgi:protein-S-isoprenylcysteine O-methyltransferase Ste14
MARVTLKKGRHNVAALDTRESSSALPVLKTILFTFLVPGTVAGYIPYRILSSRGELRFNEIGLSQMFGGLLFVLGVAGYGWCASDFARVGKGTPAPIDAPKVLVARGLYRFVRNPMYVSVLSVLLGECIFFRSMRLFGYAAAVAIGFHLFALLYEEPTLSRKFGKPYEEYCKAVRRWLPRIPNRRASGQDHAL